MKLWKRKVIKNENSVSKTIILEQLQINYAVVNFKKLKSHAKSYINREGNKY